MQAGTSELLGGDLFYCEERAPFRAIDVQGSRTLATERRRVSR